MDVEEVEEDKADVPAGSTSAGVTTMDGSRSAREEEVAKDDDEDDGEGATVARGRGWCTKDAGRDAAGDRGADRGEELERSAERERPPPEKEGAGKGSGEGRSLASTERWCRSTDDPARPDDVDVVVDACAGVTGVLEATAACGAWVLVGDANLFCGALADAGRR